MAIKRPEPELLRNIPLKFVRERVSGHGRKEVDHQIPLIPFIDFLIVLVIFLLMSFSASGELVAQQPTITMPDAKNTQQIEISPIVAVDERVITLDGTRVADTQTQGQSAQVDRIEPLIAGPRGGEAQVGDDPSFGAVRRPSHRAGGPQHRLPGREEGDVLGSGRGLRQRELCGQPARAVNFQ